MTEYSRYLTMQLPLKQSTFLWGARKTGKSHYLQKHYSESVYYNLLKTDEYFRLLKQPELLRQEVLQLPQEKLLLPIIIDEIQKIPILLNEVHYLIEHCDAYFILCGSSAKKLKQHGVNLLGGRAWVQNFYPLVYPEIQQLDLLQALNHGLLPSHYGNTYWSKSLKAYINTYLREEIQTEGLVRNLRAFAEFLDVAAFSNGEMLNYSNIARDCGVDAKTIKEYYQILVDTWLGYFIFPYKPKKNRDALVATPKFYFFDIGVVNSLCQRRITALKGSEAGAAFEQYILMELIAYRGLNDMTFPISFWRTKAGLEVDFILGDATIAIEIKISDNTRLGDLRGLQAFSEQHAQCQRAIVVNTAPRKRTIPLASNRQIEIIPWQTFLAELWAGKILS